jgi:hypothetical protein
VYTVSDNRSQTWSRKQRLAKPPYCPQNRVIVHPDVPDDGRVVAVAIEQDELAARDPGYDRQTVRSR